MFAKNTFLFQVTSAVVLICFFAGCATIVSGTRQKVEIASSPSEAHVKIYDTGDKVVWDSNTPATAKLEKGSGFFKKAQYRMVVEKEGYETQEIAIKANISGWYLFGNLLIGGLIGWVIVDPASGAMWTLRPKEINPELKSKTAFLKQDDGLMIVLRKDIPDTLFNELNPTIVRF